MSDTENAKWHTCRSKTSSIEVETFKTCSMIFSFAVKIRLAL